jgi:hypothetical protein
MPFLRCSRKKPFYNYLDAYNIKAFNRTGYYNVTLTGGIVFLVYRYFDHTPNNPCFIQFLFEGF